VDVQVEMEVSEGLWKAALREGGALVVEVDR
jgi:hypothetical protein